MRVAVLGCGPAGLLAAETVQDMGHTVRIFSRKLKSPIAGAQFMHEPVSRYCTDTPDLQITVIKSGTPEGYAENVYNNSAAKTSWERFEEGTEYGWDMKRVYDKMWEYWDPFIVETELDHHTIRSLLERYNKVISTLPLRWLCYDSKHQFKQQTVHIKHGPSVGIIPGVNDHDIMYYNGHIPEDGGKAWYRYSQLSRYSAWEYSEHNFMPKQLSMDPDSFTSIGISKPISTDCDCYDGLIRVGRYGEWDKEKLTHHVPEAVQHALL